MRWIGLFLLSMTVGAASAPAEVLSGVPLFGFEGSISLFGCGPGTGTPAGLLGDGLVVLCAAGILWASMRRSRRRTDGR